MPFARPSKPVGASCGAEEVVASASSTNQCAPRPNWCAIEALAERIRKAARRETNFVRRRTNFTADLTTVDTMVPIGVFQPDQSWNLLPHESVEGESRIDVAQNA